MSRYFFFFVLITGVSYTSSGQSVSDSLKNKPVYAAIGTYQFIYHPCKIRPLFTRETLILVEQKREESADKTIKLGPCADVFIPSRQKISSPQFIPLTETKEAD
mgnify:CR=1 FL=1